jgi:hypothetical protein
MARKKRMDGLYDPAEIARLYEEGLAQRQIAAIVGLSQGSVGDEIHRLGISARKRGAARTHTLNERYFESIDTPDKAYWLGFLAADGGLTAGRDGIAFTLGPLDPEQLPKLKAALDAGAPVVPVRQGSTFFRAFSKQMVRDLAEVGITARKSYNCEPWDAPAHLAPHYWRGLIDGDGYISQSMPQISFIGTVPMVTAWLKFANGITGTRARPMKAKKSEVWLVHLTGAIQVPALAKALYCIGGPALDRKAEAAANLIARYPPREPKACSACGAPHLALGYCKKHYQRFRKWGDPERVPTRAACLLCGAEAAARSLCGRHYMQAVREGTIASYALTPRVET